MKVCVILVFFLSFCMISLLIHTYQQSTTAYTTVSHMVLLTGLALCYLQESNRYMLVSENNNSYTCNSQVARPQLRKKKIQVYLNYMYMYTVNFRRKLIWMCIFLEPSCCDYISLKWMRIDTFIIKFNIEINCKDQNKNAQIREKY